MLPDEGIIRWLDRQARRGPLLTRGGDLHDLPEALGGRPATVEPRENPIEVEGPRLSEEEYRDSVRTLTADMRDAILAMSTGLNERALGALASKVRGLRRQALSGDLFGGFIRQNPPLPGARTTVDRDYSEMRENPADKEMSPRSFRELLFGVFDHLNDELQARAEALTKTERGYVVEKLKSARKALPNGGRDNPDGENESTDEEEKPWWVDEGPENPDRFASRNKAEQRGVLLGCGEEFHEHDENGDTFFMPCSTHGEWKKKTGRDNPSKNFHEAKIRESDDSEYETYRRDDNPDSFDRGIQILYGIRPEDEEGPRGGRSEIVSVFYPADEWNAANAERHAESTFEGFDSFKEATGGRENPSAENRSISLEINYDLEATERTHKEIIRWIRETVGEFGGDLTWTDSRGPAGAPVSIEVGIDLFGVQDAAAFQHRFETWTEPELAGVASIHTKSVGMADEIAGDGDTVVTVDVQYSARDLPQVDPGDPPEKDTFYFDAKSMVKDTLGGWAMSVTELATPRTVRFGFPTASEAIRAEAVLKDALEQYPAARVYLSSISDETASEEGISTLRANPQTSHAGGDSRLVRVTERTADLGQMESAPEVRSLIERTADAAEGEIVGVSEAPGGTVRDVYVEFESPTGAEMFTNELNTTFFTRGLTDRALAVQESPSRLAARENPSGGDGAVLRVGIQTGALPEDAHDILTMVEDAAESEGADITGVRQSDSGESKDYLVTADTTAKARSIINDLNNRFSTQGIAEAASATLQHEARQNARPNPPAVLRVGINQNRLPEDAPDMLSVVEEAAEAEDGDISGVEQSGDVKDYSISAPTTEQANAIISKLNSKFTTLGVAGATTVTLQHEARENPPGHTVRVEIPQSETVYPEDVSPGDLRQKVLETARGMGGAIRRQSDEVIEVSFDSTESAISLQEAVVDDANDMGVSNVFVLRKNMRPRPNPASTVLVRYPGGQSGLDSTVREAAEGAGGHVRSVGSAMGSKYSGMKEAEVRFNSEPDAFKGVGKIESAFRSEGIGEFEATTLAEEDVPPVRPNPIFPGGGESLLSLSSEETSGSDESALSLQDEPPEEEGIPATLQSEDPGGPATSALTVEAREAPAEVVARAYQMGKAEGEEDGLPDFNDEDDAFRHAVEVLPKADVMENVDTSTPDGLHALEEAASAWVNGYAEATGTNWPRLNPHADGSFSGSGDPDTDATAGLEPSHAPARENPEGKKGTREAISYLGMTAALLGGGVFLADSVLTERAQNAPATAIVNE